MNVKHVIETTSRIRTSRPANFVAAVLFLVAGGSVVHPHSSQVQLAVGAVFIIIGALGIYNAVVGESVVKTLHRL